MPASAPQFGSVRPRERLLALAAVGAVQLLLAFALLAGLRVQVTRAHETVQRLIEIALQPVPPPPPPPPREPEVERKVAPKPEAAPKAAPAPLGGSPGPRPSPASQSVTPIVPTRPSSPPSGGGTGSGPAIGPGAGGGTGGFGYGADGGGGTDLEQIAGDIRPSDYPRHLGNAGIGGVVTVSFTVQVNGRASGCRILRSSGLPELDYLTCRLIEKRFRFRPGTDRFGRPVADQVEWEHEWVSR